MMTRNIVMAVTAGMLAVTAAGAVSENGVVKSEILGKEMRYSVYLPEGYEATDRAYPVLYLLHGYSDDHTAWVQFGEAQRIADAAIAEGRAAPMIIVMPDAEVTFYINDIKGACRYEDYFFQELIPHIEKSFRCRTKKEHRAVAGLSMGGFGAMVYALRHPEMFAACCPLSAAFLRRERMTEHFRLGAEAEREAYLDRYSPVTLVERMPDKQKNAVRFYIDCGDDDFLAIENAQMHILLREKKIPHEYRMRDGGHTWEYWRTALPAVLEFVTASFRR